MGVAMFQWNFIYKNQQQVTFGLWAVVCRLHNTYHLNDLNHIYSVFISLLFQIYNYSLEDKKLQLSTQVLFPELILKFISGFFFKTPYKSRGGGTRGPMTLPRFYHSSKLSALGRQQASWAPGHLSCLWPSARTNHLPSQSSFPRREKLTLQTCLTY